MDSLGSVGYNGKLMLNLTILKAWVLSVMLALEPSSPLKDTFDASAEVFAASAMKSPLFCTKQEDGSCAPTDADKRKTAAFYVSVGWFEGAFQQDAKGDCDQKKPDGTCVKGATPRSFCMFQIHETNLKGLGYTKDELLTDFSKCVEAGNRLMRSSFRVCSAHPLPDRLRWYAGGGNGCPTNGDAAKKSQHRVKKAVWLYDHHPLDL